MTKERERERWTTDMKLDLDDDDDDKRTPHKLKGLAFFNLGARGKRDG